MDAEGDAAKAPPAKPTIPANPAPAKPWPSWSGKAAAIAAALFLALSVVQLQGWFKPFNEVADGVLHDGLRQDVSYQAQCKDGLCRYSESGGGLKYRAYTSKPIRNGTWNETHVVQESIVPWHGIPLQFGEESAAIAVASATCAILLLFGAWRSAIVAGVTAAIGGYLVGPVKYGGAWAPYPSGHTIGATMMWGLLLTFTLVSARRSGLVLPRNAERWVLWGWAALAVLVGFDLINSGYHKTSDIPLGWSYGAAFVFAALWLDGLWWARRNPGAKVGVEAGLESLVRP